MGTGLGVDRPLTKGQVVTGTVSVAVTGVGPAVHVATVALKPRGQPTVTTEGTAVGSRSW